MRALAALYDIQSRAVAVQYTAIAEHGNKMNGDSTVKDAAIDKKYELFEWFTLCFCSVVHKLVLLLNI